MASNAARLRYPKRGAETSALTSRDEKRSPRSQRIVPPRGTSMIGPQKPMKPFKRALLLCAIVLVAAASIAARLFFTIPSGTTAAAHFDSLIVLGYPSNPDGTSSLEQRERVFEALREYRRGVAAHIIFSGAAAHNASIEADAMARLATSQGVPAAAIVEERNARNTVENIGYSARLMHERGWSSAEIVSSPSHLPRAALILSALDADWPGWSIEWRTHASRWPPEYSFGTKLLLYAYESLRCVQLRITGIAPAAFRPKRTPSPTLPTKFRDDLPAFDSVAVRTDLRAFVQALGRRNRATKRRVETLAQRAGRA
jgi:uncharacterized SAM-binding protein YcdF (DUF218 family)